ncbi:hypothetical protein FHP29_14600 [Nocardioides albidus]|uniref:Uncharacterized protein n=1 Tax=Nocardioides albidus TaxID=1517589 RepID=A0A5C4VRE4_9ACTN|nr:hypothetical protein FHP29_14600 [Nocardioides albidus]
MAAQCPITGRPYYAVTPAAPDVVVIHAGRGDCHGNIALPAERQLSHSLDVILAQACDTVIVTVEEIVSPEVLRARPDLVEIPAFQVTAVVEAPQGAHPTSVLGYYPADDPGIQEYLDATSSGATAREVCGSTEDDYRKQRHSASWRSQAATGRTQGDA